MSPSLIPLLIAALMLIATDADVDTVEIVLSGRHQIEDHHGALIVGDARVTVPSAAEVPGPIYVIGGELNLAGAVATDVIQLAGTVTVETRARIGDELRLIGGRQSISSDSEIGRRTSLEFDAADGNPFTRLAFTGALAVLLGWLGARLSRGRRYLLDHVADAVTKHYLVSFTVGVLITLTALAVFVFMAFTVILVPVAVIGIVAGLGTLAYGVICWGHLIGTRLPVQRSGWATASGVGLTVVFLRLTALVPLVGSLVVLVIVLTSIGAVVVTYYGAAPFRPAPLPD